MDARDWTEDFEHENGNYQCKCVFCLEMFKGHKRRVVCKVCDEQGVGRFDMPPLPTGE